MSSTKTTRRASIDLGTNTCLLLIAECGMDQGQLKIQSVLEDHSTMVRLGEGVDRTRRLGDEAITRTIDCLERYAADVKRLGIQVEQVRCTATSQARDAQNTEEFFAEVQRKTGFVFRTLTGEEEARATFEGALLPGQSSLQSAVIDIGGGSTEIINHKSAVSLDMGSVRFNERYLKSDPVIDSEFWACQEAVDQALRGAGLLPVAQQWVAVAGTATSLAQWHLGLEKFDRERIDAQGRLSRGDVHRMMEELKWRSVAERAQIPGVGPGRADVILAGAMILWRLMELGGIAECSVSTRGLRYGTLLM